MEISNKIIDLEYRSIKYVCDVFYFIAEYEVTGFRKSFAYPWLGPYRLRFCSVFNVVADS
jgi:hypothetical protein